MKLVLSGDPGQDVHAVCGGVGGGQGHIAEQGQFLLRVAFQWRCVSFSIFHLSDLFFKMAGLSVWAYGGGGEHGPIHPSTHGQASSIANMGCQISRRLTVKL